MSAMPTLETTAACTIKRCEAKVGLFTAGYHPDKGVILFQLDKVISNTFKIPVANQAKVFSNPIGAESVALMGTMDAVNCFVCFPQRHWQTA